MNLTYRDRCTSGTQLDVVSGTVVVCSLRKAMMSSEFRGERWDWTWSISKGPPGFQFHWQADTKAEAQAEIEKHWRAWVDAAGLTSSSGRGGSAVRVRPA
jgi:hypothetical protein